MSTKRYTSAIHLEKNSDLITAVNHEVLLKVQREGRRLLRVENRRRLATIANDMRIPNERRNNGIEILAFLDDMRVMMKRALELQEKGIDVGDEVLFGWERATVQTIQRDF